MTHLELADKIEQLDRAMVAETDTDAEAKLGRELCDLIEGNNLKMICSALRSCARS